ncbi:GumC family protein [Pelosinus fermentans]|uniref:Lipopolysaccharide biosynthesis protein n=1 Tax=Pelosinus fermentans JBW45 TaxID=1192197 RepID=I8TS06_9FIRM|nr:GNVR domain-containing protein [Pelosinus fermentans]AJQ26009.1 lipopolysaccharide biosynthesis protein [Pelosinus fermentans JBW45]
MEETTIDLKDIIKTLKKRRGLIIKIFTGMVVFAVAISFLVPPTYEAETNLRIKQPKGLANSLLGDLPMGNSGATKQLMSTYAEILKSRTVVQAVIDKTQTDGVSEEDIPTYEQMLKRITTQPVKDTEILKVKVTAKSPEEAELVANTLVNTFNERMTYLVRSEQTGIREFIGERLKESKKELEQAETVLEKYKREQKIVAPEEETKAMVDKFAAVDKLAAENTVAMSAAQARLGTAKQQLNKEKPGFVADSPLIQQYKTKLAELEVNLVSLSSKYTEKHPEVMATRAAINETNSKLSSEISRVITADAPSMNPIHQGLLQSQIESEAEIAARTAQSQAIKGIMTSSEQDLNKLPAKEQGLAKVMRDANVNQEIYIMLAKRHEEARISEAMQPTDVQIIDVAIAPEKPISPKKTLNVVIAAILGLFVGTGIAFLLEYMNKTVRNADDVQQYLDLPVLGSIPDFDSKVTIGETGIWSNIKKMVTANSKEGRQG